MPNHDTPIQPLCTSPREMGKRAYKEGIRRGDNPFAADPIKKEEWAEGWLYQHKHYPSAKDAMASESDMDCLSPWQGDDSGYGGYW